MDAHRFAAVAALILLLADSAPAAAPLRTAVLAGGCFWSLERAMEEVPGVVDVVSGYAGGAVRNPTYEHHPGHLEAVQVTYDPARTGYWSLLAAFFRHIDPTDPNGQFCDQGPSYRTAAFVASPQERQAAEAVKAEVARTLRKPVATRIAPARRFWPAEARHQDYARKHPLSYKAYRIGCRRDARLKAVWQGR